jgi:hypothetical protein
LLEVEGEAPGSHHRARSPDGAGGLPQQIVTTIEQLAVLEATLWSILEGMKSNVTYVAFFLPRVLGHFCFQGAAVAGKIQLE